MLRCWLVHIVEDALQVALDNVQRCAQLVSHIGREIATPLVGAFQFLDHAVKRLGQPAELTRPMFRRRYLHAQVPLGHGVGGGHDGGQRGGDVPKGSSRQHCRQQWQRQRQAAAPDPGQHRRLPTASEQP